MIRKHSFTLAAALATALLITTWAISNAKDQSRDPQSAPQLSAEQQKQLDQLKQLEQQLQKDREAVHAAIMDFGWDSDQADKAQEQLFRDREEYRKMRRSLRSAGVPVPPPAGFALGGPRSGRGAGRGHHRGPGHHGGCRCDCPCCEW